MIVYYSLYSRPSRVGMEWIGEYVGTQMLINPHYIGMGSLFSLSFFTHS